jgi:hypothetical protein
MGQLVFQATAGGQVALVGPNPSTSFALNVPAVNGNLVTTGDTGTVTNTMLASNVYTAPGTIGSGTPNTGAFTTLSASSTVSGTGFSTYLASPPAIGGTSPSTGKFTSVTDTGLTSGRVTYATTGGLLTDSAGLTFNGTNLTLGTSNGGIVFNNSSALTNSTLNDYEVGTWTPSDASGAGLTFTSASGYYVKVGRIVYANFSVVYPTTANGNSAIIGGLPFTAISTGTQGGCMITSYSNSARNIISAVVVNTSTGQLLNLGFSTSITNAQMSTFRQDGTYIYEASF